jgi:hypothetical protein
LDGKRMIVNVAKVPQNKNTPRKKKF